MGSKDEFLKTPISYLPVSKRCYGGHTVGSMTKEEAPVSDPLIGAPFRNGGKGGSISEAASPPGDPIHPILVPGQQSRDQRVVGVTPS